MRRRRQAASGQSGSCSTRRSGRTTALRFGREIHGTSAKRRKPKSSAGADSRNAVLSSGNSHSGSGGAENRSSASVTIRICFCRMKSSFRGSAGERGHIPAITIGKRPSRRATRGCAWRARLGGGTVTRRRRLGRHATKLVTIKKNQNPCSARIARVDAETLSRGSGSRRADSGVAAFSSKRLCRGARALRTACAR